MYYTWSIQYTLNELGYSLARDGIFYTATETKVKNLQQNNGTNPADGIVGEHTYRLLSLTSY